MSVSLVVNRAAEELQLVVTVKSSKTKDVVFFSPRLSAEVEMVEMLLQLENGLPCRQ